MGAVAEEGGGAGEGVGEGEGAAEEAETGGGAVEAALGITDLRGEEAGRETD